MEGKFGGTIDYFTSWHEIIMRIINILANIGNNGYELPRISTPAATANSMKHEQG